MIKFCSTVLFVQDINISRQFYQDLLHQQVEIDYGACVAFVGGFSIWQKDIAYNNIFKKSCTTSIELTESHGHQIELYFETEDLDDVYSRLSSYEMVHDMFEQPWGQRVFRVFDPDQYIIELAEPMNTVIKRFYMSGMTAEEVAERASTPLSIVNTVIESVRKGDANEDKIHRNSSF